MKWFIFNEYGEIISDAFESEEKAIEAMNNGEYDSDEIANYVDGLNI